MDVYEREFGDLLHYKPKITVYEQFVLQNLNRMLRLYNFLPRNIIMLRFEELWQRHLLRHPEIRKTREEERKNPRKSRWSNRQRAPRTLGKNALRARVSDDVDLYTSPAPKSKASRKRWSTKQEKRSSPKASRARCYPPLKIKTLKRTLPVSEENHAAPSTVPPPQERSRHFLPCTRSSAHKADNELGGAVLVQTNSNAKSREDGGKCLNNSAAVEENTVLQKPIENEKTSLPSPRHDPNKGIRKSFIPNTRCPPKTPLASAAAEREDAATAEEAIEMGRMGTPSNRNKHEREIRTVLFSEPMSLYSSVGHEEIYVRDCTPTEMPAATEDDVFEEPVNQLTSPMAAREKGKTTMLLSEPMSLCDGVVLGKSSAQSFMSTEDACDRQVDPSASKKQKPFQRKLSLTRRSEPLQSNVTNEDAMHARPIGEKVQLGADEELKISPVHEIQRGEKQILYEPPQRFGDAVSETATQNRQFAETRAEEQPVGPEKEQYLLGTIQQSRFVHNKLEMQPAAAKRSDGKHQIFPPNGISGLADIVHSARPRKFEHCKVSQESEPSETKDIADAATGREQCDVSRVVGELSAVKQTVRQRVHSSRRTEGRETTVILPRPESRGVTEGRSKKLDSACIEESSTLNLCHAEVESDGSCWPERTSKSAHVDCKASRAEVMDSPSLPKGRDGAASSEFAHNPNAKSIAMVRAGHKKTKMPKRKELPCKDFQADPIPGTEHPAPPQQQRVKWKDTTKQKKTKCTPGAGVADVHDDRESPWDESGQDDKLFPFITKRNRIDKRKGGKKATDKERQDKKTPDEERPGRRQLLEDKIADVDLIGGVCNEKGTVRPIAKDVEKKKHDNNHVDNVPDEGRHCRKKSVEARSDGKGVDETGCAERQMTEKSKCISTKQNRADKQTEKRSKKTASLQSVSIAKKLVSETPGETKHGKKQQDEGRFNDEEPDKTQQAGRKPSRGALRQIKCHREKDGRKRPFQAVPEESLAHEGRRHEKHQSDGKSDGMHKEKVPLEKEATKADQGKENCKQVVTEVSNEKKQDACRSGKEGHNEKEQKITKPIKKARDQTRKEADSFFLSFEEDVTRDSTYFPDELELEELSNEIDNDFSSDEGPNENILGEENCTFGGGDEKTATGNARFVPFSLESDEDRPKEGADESSNFFSSSLQKKQKMSLSFSQKSSDSEEASNFFSSSLQKKQKMSLSFSQKSSDSEELFSWPVGDQPKAKHKKSVQFTDPGFQVPSPKNNDTESFDTCESGSRATTPPCTKWKDIVTRSVTFPDPTSPDRTDTRGNEIVQELRRNFEKHRAIFAAKCVPDVNEPSQGWSGSDDYPILLSRDRPEFFGSSPEDSPKFDV